MRIAASATYFPKCDEFVPLEVMGAFNSAGVDMDILLDKKKKLLGVRVTICPENCTLWLDERAELTVEQLRSISRATLEQLGAKLQAACMDELSHGSLIWSEERVKRFRASDIVRQICADVLGGDLHWLEADSADA